MTKRFHLTILSILLFGCNTFAQKIDSLRERIQQIISTKNAVVGVSIIGNNGKDTLTFNGDRHYPLQSVFKFHIALAVLSQIDKGKYTLDQEITVRKEELLPNLWSPLREENPNGGKFTLSKLIQYSVSQSDNVGCDVLLRVIGGPKVVEKYIKQNNIQDISIQLNEENIQKNRELMFQNWTTPKAANETLTKFYFNKNKLLSESSYDFVWKTMKETETGKGRLKGQLPKETIVAHKTGSSGTSRENITEAVNDIGIVFLPNGEYFFISVFVTNSKENEETNEKIIAAIAKASWDYFTAKKK